MNMSLIFRRILIPAAVLSAASCAVTPREITNVRGGPLATLLDQESIRSLHEPDLLIAERASARMRNGEKVLGLVVGEHAVAISLRVLDDHEIVNLEPLDASGPALAATW